MSVDHGSTLLDTPTAHVQPLQLRILDYNLERLVAHQISLVGQLGTRLGKQSPPQAI